MAAIFRTTRGNEYSSPRTVLGFYAGVLIILEVGVVAVVAFLASQNDLHHLIPWAMAFGAVAFLGIVVVVVSINFRDPTKLQLGQMTGREFVDYQRVTRGDSIGGEYVEPPPGTEMKQGQVRALPPIDAKTEAVDAEDKKDDREIEDA